MSKNNTYPCDLDGICPFDAQYSEDCRVNCGLGVDENSNPEEDEDDEDYLLQDLYLEQIEQM